MPAFDADALRASLLMLDLRYRTRLKAHNDSFDQLLRRIPARYYIRKDDSDEEQEDTKPNGPLTKAQKKALKRQRQDPEYKQQKALALKQAKLARYDPDEPQTIPEIQQARQQAKLERRQHRDDSDDEDDERNWQDVDSDTNDDMTQNVNVDDEDEQDSPNDTDFEDSDEEDIVMPASTTLLKQQNQQQSGPAPTVTELRERLRQRIEQIQAAKRATTKSKKHQRDEAQDDDNDDEDDNEDGGASLVKSKEDLLEERRRRGVMRDNRRKKRKQERKLEALNKPKRDTKEQPSNGRKGGGKANAPGRATAEDDADQDKPRRKAKLAESSALAPASTIVSTARPVDPEAFTFSNLDFDHQTLKSANATLDPKQKQSKSFKQHRLSLPKDPNQALQVLQARKEKLQDMTPEQREKIEQRDRWDKVELKAQGDKIRDDEKRLKKMAKRMEQQKRKSAKAWNERTKQVQTNISARIDKRNANLAARAQAAKDKKAGIKKPKSSSSSKGSGSKTKSSSHLHRAKTSGRPGFEGKGGKKK
ncbi:hypothetical protein OIO90_005419 [Microbotryomycetes sp. JL221]|nr:hypothetical protein OIO90_005419 [Microbotryomycetes sp. JL221]